MLPIKASALYMALGVADATDHLNGDHRVVIETSSVACVNAFQIIDIDDGNKIVGTFSNDYTGDYSVFDEVA